MKPSPRKFISIVSPKQSAQNLKSTKNVSPSSNLKSNQIKQKSSMEPISKDNSDTSGVFKMSFVSQSSVIDSVITQFNHSHSPHKKAVTETALSAKRNDTTPRHVKRKISYLSRASEVLSVDGHEQTDANVLVISTLSNTKPSSISHLEEKNDGTLKDRNQNISKSKKAEVKKKNVEEILESPVMLEKIFPKNRMTKKRRKSCQCSDCGGISKLEKRLDKNVWTIMNPKINKDKRKDARKKKSTRLLNRGTADSASSRSRSQMIMKKSSFKIKTVLSFKKLPSKQLHSEKSKVFSRKNSEVKDSSIDSRRQNYSIEDTSPREVEAEANKPKSRKKIGNGKTGELDDADTVKEPLVIEQEEDEFPNISIDLSPEADGKVKTGASLVKLSNNNGKASLKSLAQKKTLTEVSQTDGTQKSEKPSKINKLLQDKDERRIKAAASRLETESPSGLKSGEEASPLKLPLLKVYKNKPSEIMSIYSRKRSTPVVVPKLGITTTEPSMKEIKRMIITTDSATSTPNNVQATSARSGLTTEMSGFRPTFNGNRFMNGTKSPRQLNLTNADSPEGMKSGRDSVEGVNRLMQLSNTPAQLSMTYKMKPQKESSLKSQRIVTESPVRTSPNRMKYKEYAPLKLNSTKSKRIVS